MPAACSWLPHLGPNLTEHQHAQLQARTQTVVPLDAFYLSARLALNADNHAWSGNLRWEQQPSSYVMTFNTPTGQGAMQLKGDHTGVHLKLANGDTQTADDAEDLLYNQTGLNLPLDGLRYWVKGIPQPDNGNDTLDAVQFDTQGRLSYLEQAGWTIRYSRYRLIDGVAMPGKLDMHHNAIKLRIFIDHWETIAKK